MIVAMVTMKNMSFCCIIMDLSSVCIKVSMTANIFEVPDKYFDRLTWNIIFSYRKGNFVFSFKFCMKYVGFPLFIEIGNVLGNVLP